MSERRTATFGAAAKLLPAFLFAALTAATALAFSCTLATAARADSLNELALPAENDEAEIFELRLGTRVLRQDLPVYRQGEIWLVPLGELCRLLDLAVEVDSNQGLASGFLIDEKKRFQLDLKFRRVASSGQQTTFAETEVVARDGDLYVAAATLEKWLPLRLEISASDLLIRVKSSEKLPLELRLEREKKLAASHRAEAAAELPRLALPYRLFDGPFLDATLRYGRRAASGSGSDSSLEYSLAATGDLLFLEASLFLYGNQQEILDSRLSLGRKDPQGHLLGPLGAREVTFGEVFHPGLELVALPRSGPGFSVGNFPLGQLSQLGRESFRGDLPPGWEAELYRGEELLAYARSRPDGLYEFLEVPLLGGLNVFRIELYGPQGQRHSERRLLNAGDALTPPGKVYYRVAGNDPGARLVGRGPTGVGPRASFELGAGFAHHLSAAFALSTLELAGRSRTYAQAGLRTFRGPLLASLDVAAEKDGGSAWQGEVQTRWRTFGLQLEEIEIDGLPSERFSSPDGDLRRRSSLRLDTIVPAAGLLPRLPLYFELRQDRFTSGRRLTAITSRVSAFHRGLSLANQLTYTAAGGGGFPAPASATGQLLVSQFLARLALRGEADYHLAPEAQLRSLALEAEIRVRHGLLLSGGVSRAMAAHANHFEVGVSRLEGPFGWTTTADYRSDRGFGVSVLLSVSLSRDSRSGDWHHQARPLAFAGGLSGHAFLDSNGNGKLDPGEKPVAGAGLLLSGAANRQRSNQQGDIFISNLAPYEPLGLAVAPATLDDPYWQPASAGVSILPRPGKVAVVDFPIEICGEVLGTVFLQYTGQRREAGGVEIELVAAGGEVVARTRSAADGFYDLDRLRPGRYTLRVAAAQVARLHLLTAPQRDIEIGPEGSVLEDINFLLLTGEI